MAISCGFELNLLIWWHSDIRYQSAIWYLMPPYLLSKSSLKIRHVTFLPYVVYFKLCTYIISDVAHTDKCVILFKVACKCWSCSYCGNTGNTGWGVRERGSTSGSMTKTLAHYLVPEHNVRVLLETVVVNNEDDSCHVPLRSFTMSSSAVCSDGFDPERPCGRNDSQCTERDILCVHNIA